LIAGRGGGNKTSWAGIDRAAAGFEFDGISYDISMIVIHGYRIIFIQHIREHDTVARRHKVRMLAEALPGPSLSLITEDNLPAGRDGVPGLFGMNPSIERQRVLRAWLRTGKLGGDFE